MGVVPPFFCRSARRRTALTDDESGIGLAVHCVQSSLFNRVFGDWAVGGWSNPTLNDSVEIVGFGSERG